MGKDMCISRTTSRRLKEVNYNFQESRFTSISDLDLNQQVAGIKAEFENCGERMVIGILRARGVHVPRHRVRDIIRRIAPINTAFRWQAMHPRYQYDVPGPNALWHIDGLHKLIRWGFVVHGGIDGFSRIVVFLTCATNNREETVMTGFSIGTRKYGIPSRVRQTTEGKISKLVDLWSRRGEEFVVPIFRVHLYIISELRGYIQTLPGVVSLSFIRSSAIWKVKVFWTSPMIRISFTYQ